eukprot:g2009.t1
MALLTAYNELNSELEHEGLEAVVKRGDGINVTDHDLYRFEVKYAKSWELYKKIQSHTAMPLFVFWFIELGLVIWSVWSMAQGAQSDVNDWRVPHLKSYWNLVVRLSWFVGGSPWFGAGCWITALLPWGSIYYAWRMNNLSKRLIFKNPTTRQANLAKVSYSSCQFWWSTPWASSSMPYGSSTPYEVRAVPLEALARATSDPSPDLSVDTRRRRSLGDEGAAAVQAMGKDEMNPSQVLERCIAGEVPEGNALPQLLHIYCENPRAVITALVLQQSDAGQAAVRAGAFLVNAASSLDQGRQSEKPKKRGRGELPEVSKPLLEHILSLTGGKNRGARDKATRAQGCTMLAALALQVPDHRGAQDSETTARISDPCTAVRASAVRGLGMSVQTMATVLSRIDDIEACVRSQLFLRLQQGKLW